MQLRIKLEDRGLPFSTDNTDHLVRAVMHAVREYGVIRESDGGLLVQELLSVNTVLTNPRARLFRAPQYPHLFNPGLAVARFFYLISGSNDLEQICFYSPAARRFSDDGITMPGGAHGRRLFYPTAATDQFMGVIKSLQEHPERNRAAVAFYHPDDCGSPSVDLTCVMGGMFSCKEGRMRTLINMRANDTVPLLWYDLFEFSMLGEFIASYCGFELGEYYHSSFVMMVIGKPAMLVADALPNDTSQSPVMAAMPEVAKDTRAHLVHAERRVRSSVAQASFDEFRRLLDKLHDQENSYWADLFTALAVQGRYVHTDPHQGSVELPLLAMPAEYIVSRETLTNSMRIVERSLSRPAGGSHSAVT